jgi:hypothetical protein
MYFHFFVLCCASLFVLASYADELGTFDSKPSTIAAATDETSMSARILRKALDHLVKETVQNKFYQQDNVSMKSVSLVLSAFIRYGEVESSFMFGDSIKALHRRLLLANPENMDDKLAVIIGLSDYWQTHRDSKTSDRISELIVSLEDRHQGKWSDLFGMISIPNEEIRPQWSVYSERTLMKFTSFEINDIDTLDDFLTSFLISNSMRRLGDKTWNKHRTRMIKLLSMNQREDGSIAVRPNEDSIAATALSCMVLCLEQQGAHVFSRVMHNGKTSVPQKEPPVIGTDVEIDIDQN